MTSSAATGVLGFVFWTVAARGYDTAEVGRASAIISSATLIAILANFSLGSLYERFLPLAGSQTPRVVRQGITLVAGTALVFGTVFVVVGPREQLFPSRPEALLFPAFVAVLAIYALQDPILIGLARARTIATKNIGQSTAKLVVVAALIPVASGAAIVWSWVLPAAVITAVIAIVVIRRETATRTGPAVLPPRRELFEFFASSYAINAVGVTVPLLVPLIVVAQLGTEMNAYFSMCWLVVNTLGVLIGATAAPFIATASTPGADLRSCTVRFVALCGGAAVLGCVALLVTAPLILGILGPHYAEHGTGLIRIMALTLPSVALMTIYTALARLQRRLRLAVAAQILLGVVVVSGVTLTTHLYGINAVGYTYLAAELLNTAVVAVPTAILLRKVAATPRGHALDATSPPPRPDPPRPDLSRTAPIEYRTVTERFEEVATEKADCIALHTDRGSITYGALHAAANGWSAELAGRAEPGSAVALVADLEPATAAVVLGSFAAGAPLVPLDTGLPHDRMVHIVDALAEQGYRLQTVVADEIRAPVVAGLAGTHTVWATHRPVDTVARPVARPDLGLQSVTSIQFTSGSSGEPKAVLHVHGTWLSDWILHRDRFGIVDGRRVALCMPVSFAAGLNVLVGALLSGAEVVAIDPRTCTPEAALDRLRDCDIVMCTPSFLHSVTDAAGGRVLHGVQRIVTTGEPLYGSVIRAARVFAPNAVLTNWAGSSETLGIAHFDMWPEDEIPRGVVPAGVAVPHKTLAVDDDGRLTVTSPYLAAGYLKPELATTTFTANPDGSRTFVTNDRARLTDDGVLMVLGRTDVAVKIRGYLVEPAEVEAALLECTGIREALVVADQAAETPTLTAYVAPTPGMRTPAVADVRAQLHTRLPAWMVPTHVVMLQSLPRNERGKVDRQALPAPVRGPIVPPRAGLESELAAAWADALRLDTVGRDENFYALGGDSLNVQQMIAAVGTRYGVQLATSDLAGAPTVAQFAEAVEARRAGAPASPGRRPAPTTVVLRAASESTRGILFCFAGAGASALTFAPLADRVGDSTAVVAFQAQGLENRAFPDWTVGRAARRHLADLLALQPEGPYRLVGHSLGAFIAVDVANRLRALGRHVESVTMLDPFLPPRTVQAAERHLPGIRSTLLEQKPADRSVLWRHRMWLPLAGIVDGPADQKVIALREVGVRVGRLHRPKPYAGRTLLVLSSFNLDDDRVWAQLLTGDLTVVRIHCDHDSVVREPHVGRVAELIGELDGQDGAGGSRTSPITP
ncbi:acyl-coenzyme A synthetase/AMP-(fatty) acid ligase/thioesterase domain-containing protein/O-antigen/teichoic acid export membrane protein/acyl carrier protein [Mycolicibacterium iranicum]|uniref:Acyl-coenzyme A synthetase/AMP-(Fatty) acid ligase/thioesterase domain-containing protein/O-antigen/teichoic acid export membrane protein/acyl carrier protein n=1 Tax=Mycolicibacterium iranicum TaxID=912594 RepID=A0A839Q299_MYCIR|nr:alpha/beta fold hydrolase [Mycolicibacterium iranicum]MBB2990458.1 acyl-coenzyme A synthetase/AMP-(fatty) acid ligase/thioesterase domain-containing protein/O-antigen/teichoic acid export membrane protein/acyl carrier protein [Mycolicibacterium iranicum]